MRKNYFFDFIMIALILMIAIKIMFPDILTTKIIVQVTSPDVIVETGTISDLPDITVNSDDIIVDTPVNTSVDDISQILPEEITSEVTNE